MFCVSVKMECNEYVYCANEMSLKTTHQQSKYFVLLFINTESKTLSSVSMFFVSSLSQSAPCWNKIKYV